MSEKNVTTRHGSIHVHEQAADAPGMPVILLHGNSASGRCFTGLLGQEALAGRRVIVPDFPGHGQSPAAQDPEQTYGMYPFRDVIADLIEDFGLSSCVLFGWSMGGHVALELMDHPAVAGAMICGTPPVGMDVADVIAGFRQNDLGDLTYKAHFTDQEAHAYALAGVGREDLLTPQMVEDARTCDGVFRGILGQSLAQGMRSDHRHIAETTPKPLCAMNGEKDALIAAEFLQTVAYANPWRETPYIFSNAGHAPFLDEPETVARMIAAFAEELEA